MSICQLIIMLCGLTTATIFNICSPKIRRWGSLSSLIGQPFWLYVTFTSHQYGMFVITFYYTAMAVMGVYNGFIRKIEGGK